MWQADYCGQFGRRGWPLVQFFTRPYLVQRQLAVEPQEGMELVLAYWLVELGSRV